MWRKVSPSTWEQLEKKAQQFHNTKLSYKSTAETQWGMDAKRRINVRLAGLIGEALVASELGWRQNLRLMPGGDGGYDFPGIDVKTSTFISDPHLKVAPDKLTDGKIYVLVAVDMRERKASIVGHATAEMIRSKNYTKDYGGYGETMYLTSSDLTPGLPVVTTTN